MIGLGFGLSFCPMSAKIRAMSASKTVTEPFHPSLPLRLTFRFPVLAGSAFLLALSGAAPRSEAQSFETPPEMKASDLLEPVWLSSEYHSVDPTVVAEHLLDHYLLRAGDQVREVYGTEMLKMRVREIHAYMALDKKNVAGAAIGGLVGQGVSTVKTLGGAVKKPVRTIFNIPKGVVSMVKRGVSSTENKVKADGTYTGGPIQDWFQVSEKKLALAAKLGVDPYTDNQALQKELTRLANSAAIGGIGLKVAIPGDGLITAAEEGDAAQQLKNVYLTPPTRLFQENVGLLEKVGIAKDRAGEFMGRASCSPADQSLIIRALAGIGVSDGVEEWLSAIEQIDSSSQSQVFRRSAQILQQHAYAGHPFAALTSFRSMPVGITQDKHLVVPAYLDHAYWTEDVSEGIAAILKLKQETGCTAVDLIYTGSISPLARKELGARGVTLIPVKTS